jgi:digeranylgeranylglycerophospholipid reductase
MESFVNVVYVLLWCLRKSVLTQKADVIVVGGGPCGLFSALTAAKLGVDVIVCEEHKEIGVPSHCAGHVSLNGLKRLRLDLPREVVENEIKGAVFYSPSGYEFRVRFDSPVTCVLNRVLFDKFLAKLTEEVGVTYQFGTRVESLFSDSGQVKGVSVKGEVLKSNIVIDCEGCSSILLKKASFPTLDKSMVVKGVEAEVDKVEDVNHDTVEVYLGQKYAPSLFAWIIPRPDGSAKVGLATKTGNPKTYLQNFFSHNPKAIDKLRHSKFVSVSYHSLTLGGPLAKTYHNGLLIVGDAASQVKPTTGGGVIMGLNCAKIAGETASEAIKHGDSSAGFLSRYQRRWQKAIGFDMTVMRQMRLMLNRLPDRRLDKIIALCSQLHLNEDLKHVGDIDFQGKGIIPVFKSPAAWTVAIYSILSSLTSPL